MDSIVAPLHVTSTVPLLPNTPIVFESGIPNHITVKTKNFKRDDHTGVLLGAHPGDGHPRYVGVLLEGITTIIAPLKDSEATVVLEEICLDYADAAFTLERGSSPNPLLGRTLQREKAADDGNITIAIHVKRKIVSAKRAITVFDVTTKLSKDTIQAVLKKVDYLISSQPTTRKEASQKVTKTAPLSVDTVTEPAYETTNFNIKTEGVDMSISSGTVVYIKTESIDKGEQIVWTEKRTPIVPTEAIPYILAPKKATMITKDAQPIPVFTSGQINVNIQIDPSNKPSLATDSTVRVQFNPGNPSKPVWGSGPGGFRIGTAKTSTKKRGGLRRELLLERKPAFDLRNEPKTQDRMFDTSSLDALMKEANDQYDKAHDKTLEALVLYMFNTLNRLAQDNGRDSHKLAILIQIRNILTGSIEGETTFDDADPKKELIEKEINILKKPGAKTNSKAVSQRLDDYFRSIRTSGDFSTVNKFKDFLKIIKLMTEEDLRSRLKPEDQPKKNSELRHALATSVYEGQWKGKIPQSKYWAGTAADFNKRIDELKVE